MFLAKFLAELVSKYYINKKIYGKSDKFSPSNIYAARYKLALEETLLDMAVEDMKEHARLLVYKEMLISLCNAEDC